MCPTKTVNSQIDKFINCTPLTLNQLTPIQFNPINPQQGYPKIGWFAYQGQIKGKLINCTPLTLNQLTLIEFNPIDEYQGQIKGNCGEFF